MWVYNFRQSLSFFVGSLGRGVHLSRQAFPAKQRDVTGSACPRSAPCAFADRRAENTSAEACWLDVGAAAAARLLLAPARSSDGSLRKSQRTEEIFARKMWDATPANRRKTAEFKCLKTIF